MAISPGTSLGHYEITGSLGAGGMGEVYRARDQKLDREVAIKVLPEDFAANEERLARFEREARALAALNHPNVATVHGFEQEGSTHFLVMELVEGEELAGRIARGKIPIREAVPLFLQIGEGLEAAHERGIIHRDLKPANIKVLENGRAKILDFGLAKEIEPASTSPELSHSPTMTAAATMRGEIMGTAAYMSPEQARGKKVDRRTDVWAFGVCLFEALTGVRPFAGEDALSTLARVLDREPEFGLLEGPLSPFRCLIGRCLAKDPSRRYRDIGDVCLDLETALDASQAGELGAATAAVSGMRLREVLAWGAALLLALLAGLLFLRQSSPSSDTSFAGRTSRTEIAAPHLEPEEAASLSISPDGRTVVYFGREGSTRRLYRRDLDQLEAEPIAGSENSWGFQFFSPDGKWIVHMTEVEDYRLQKLPLDGGRPIDLLIGGLVWGGGDWNADGTLLIGRREDELIHVLSEEGGDSVPITRRNEGEARHREPHFVPGSDQFLFSVRGVGGEDHIAIQSRSDKGGHRILTEGRSPQFLDSGHLLIHRKDGLWLAPFDAKEANLTGEPRPLRDVPYIGHGNAAFESASGGTLVYTPRASGVRGPLLWLDRDGRESRLGLPSGAYVHPRLSPDGQRIAFAVSDQVGGFGRLGHVDLMVLELGSIQPRLIQTDSEANMAPLWALDSRTLLFQARDQDSTYTLQVAEGGGVRATGMLSKDTIEPLGWTDQGRVLVSTMREDSIFGNVLLDLETSEVEPLFKDQQGHSNGVPSPDGRWFAYQRRDNDSNDLVTVRSLDDDDRTWPIAEGTDPLWTNANGGELFFLREDALMSVSMSNEPPFVRGDPKLVIRGPYFEAPLYARPYDYDPVNDRFLVIRHSTEPRSLVVVQGLHHELEG